MNIDVTLELTDDTAEKARRSGLLTSEKLSALVEAEIERQREEAWQRLKEISNQLQENFVAEYGHLSEEEAQAIIDGWIEEAEINIRATRQEENARCGN